MRATKLSISKAVLVNLGDYQNEKVEMSLDYEIEPGETAEQAHAQASEEFKTLLLKELEPTFAHMSSYKRDAWLERLGIEKPKPIEEAMPNDADDEDYGDPDSVGDEGNEDDIEAYEVDDEAD